MGCILAEDAGMIAFPPKILVAIQPIDMRRGADGLASVIQNTLGQLPFDGTAYLFRNRQGHRLKMLIADGQGLWLCQRRLHQGSFVWPQSTQDSLTLTPDQWRWLVAGIDWKKLSEPPPGHWRL